MNPASPSAACSLSRWRESWRRIGAGLCRALPWICIAAPVLLCARLMYLHTVNVPFLDDWMFTPMYEKARHGTLTMHDFFVVQMEHRLAWPRAVMLLLDRIMPGRFTAQCWVTWTLLVLTLVNIGVLLKRTGQPFRHWWPVLALSSLCLFSPLLYQILLWPMMFQVVTPLWALTTALAVIGASRWPFWVRLGLCILVAEAATLSLVSGLLIWPLFIPVILWSGAFAVRRARYVFLAAWLVVFALTTVLYFHDLKNETDPQFAYHAGRDEVTATRGLSAALSDPGHYLEFVARLPGGPLSRGLHVSMRPLAFVIGALSLLLLTAATVHWLNRFRDEEWRRQMIPWLVLGFYTAGTAALVALGRAWAARTGANALQARYVIHAIPLTIALVVIGWLMLRRRQERAGSAAGPAPWLGPAAFAVLLVWQLIGWLYGAQMMAVWESARLRGAANTLFFKLADQPGHKELFNPRQFVCPNIAYASRMDDMGLLARPMLKNDRLDNFRVRPVPVSRNTASFQSLRSVFGGKLRARGFALLPKTERVADALLFTFLDGRERRIFHVAQVDEMPMALDEVLGRDLRFTMVAAPELRQHLSAFDVELPIDALPEGRHDITLYMLDYETGYVHAVPGRFRVWTKSQGVRRIPPVSVAPEEPPLPEIEPIGPDAAMPDPESTR